MARGKHGQIAQAKADGVARDQIQALEAELAGERAAHRQTRHELMAEVQNLKGQFTSSVKAHASEAIMLARDSASAEVAAARADCDERVRQTLKFVFTHARTQGGVRFTRFGEGGWDELSKIAGLPLGEIMTLDPEMEGTDRAIRRATSRTFNRARTGFLGEGV